MRFLFQDAQTLWRGRRLLWVMTKRELATRYAGSAIGAVWAYIQPILTIGAYFLVFDLVFTMRMSEGAGTTRVGTYLVVGALPWLAFCESVSRGASSLLDAAGVLQKNALAPTLFVTKSVLASWVVFAPLLLLLALIYIPINGLHLALLAFPVLLLVQCVLVWLIAHVLAILAAAVRDVIQVLAFGLSVGIYLSPILFPLSLFPKDWQWVLFANPMTALVIGYQDVLLKGTWPSATVWWVSGSWLLIIALVLNVLIQRSKDQLVDWL